MRRVSSSVSFAPIFTDVRVRTLKSPQILELSGIGNPEILNKIGVPLKVDLPGVGENVQDHLLYGMSYGAPLLCFQLTGCHV